jgi:hypothetical protein
MASDQSHVVSEILDQVVQAAVEAVPILLEHASHNSSEENTSASPNSHVEDSSSGTAQPVMTTDAAERVCDNVAPMSLQHATIIEDPSENETSPPQNLENAPNFTLNLNNETRKQDNSNGGMDSMLSAASSLPHQGSMVDLEGSVRCVVQTALGQTVEAATANIAAMTTSSSSDDQGPGVANNTQDASPKEQAQPDAEVRQSDTENIDARDEKKVCKYRGRH